MTAYQQLCCESVSFETNPTAHQPIIARNERLVIVSNTNYCKIYNISRTKSPNLNVSRLVLQLSLPNPMKPGVKSRMKM